MKSPLVSIIIPTYNYAQYIQEAIDSALAQSYKNIEILVVDDASSDNTAEIVKHFGNKVRYYAVTHGGVSKARNFGAGQAKGLYTVFLDADDKLHPDFVKKTLQLLQTASPDTGYVYTQWQYFEASHKLTQFPGYNLAYLKIKNFLGPNTLIYTELVREYPYDSRLAVWEDWDFYLTLAERGTVGVLLNEPLLYYRKHSTGGSALDTFTNKKQLYCSHILRTKHRKLYGRVDTFQHYLWYLFNTFKLRTQGQAYQVKAPDDRTGLNKTP